MVSTVSRTVSRTDSPARWTRAADRAIAEGVRVMQLPTTGVWVATSGTDAATAYVVTETGCECHAGAHGDPCCKHRAALRLHLGLLAAPVVPAPVAAVCDTCRGSGTFRTYYGDRLNDYVTHACRCGAAVAA